MKDEAEYSKEGYGSKGTLLPMMMITQRNTINDYTDHTLC
jgi:hypothetical protein